MNLILLLDEFVYPPVTIDDANTAADHVDAMKKAYELGKEL